uniref:Phosphotransacetylase n=1 Tax=Geoglobus ahangari TaxID=113653 RepID=A0A7C3YDT6_9EURY
MIHEIIRKKLVERKRIAVGLYRFDETCEKRIKKAKELAKDFADVVIIDEGEETEKTLIDLLKKGEVDAAIRGTARASKILEILRRDFTTYRIALLETANGKLFLLAPVGVDEGKSVKEKLIMIEEAKKISKKLGLDGTVAILAGGRYGDIGRSDTVDISLAIAELTAKLADAKNYEIKLEEAVREDIVIAPDGISGNLIFRSLCYLGNGREYGAVYTNLPFKLVDTSRSQSPEGYARAIALASVI